MRWLSDDDNNPLAPPPHPPVHTCSLLTYTQTTTHTPNSDFTHPCAAIGSKRLPQKEQEPVRSLPNAGTTALTAADLTSRAIPSNSEIESIRSIG